MTTETTNWRPTCTLGSPKRGSWTWIGAAARSQAWTADVRSLNTGKCVGIRPAWHSLSSSISRQFFGISCRRQAAVKKQTAPGIAPGRRCVLPVRPSDRPTVLLLCFHFCRERTRRRRSTGQGRFQRRRRRLEALRRLDLDVVIPVNAGTRRDQMPDDDVLLETKQIVLGPTDRRIGQHPGRFLERRRRDERLRRQARLRDTEQQRLAGRRLAALLHC